VEGWLFLALQPFEDDPCLGEFPLNLDYWKDPEEVRERKRKGRREASRGEKGLGIVGSVQKTKNRDD
jgi:hypothetical protein